MPKAYSYLRFSTAEQMGGDSFRRQSDLARDYVARHGLELDTELTMQDLGVSAFRGKNATTGALFGFLQAINNDLVPEGSTLLVESLDRVTRQDPWSALPTFQQIINAGVTIVTLQDGKVYSRAEMIANPFRLMESLFVMIRANEESATKARRLRAAWDTKRSKAGTKPLTALCPAWLKARQDRSGFDLIPERAATVKVIYELAAGGMGQHGIATKLNNDDVPTFGLRSRHWLRTYITRILRNPAAIGTCVPHETDPTAGRRIRRPLEPLPGYYPAAVDQDLYERVQALQIDTPNPQRGRNAALPVSNVLGGIARCPLCGDTMTRVSKGPKQRPYLVCTAAKAGAGCGYHTVRYEDVESCIVERRDQLVAECPTGSRDPEVDEELANLEEEIDQTLSALQNLLATVEAGGGQQGREVAHRLRELETRLETLRQQETDLQRRAAAASGPMLARRLEDLGAALANVTEDRGPANALLRTLLSGAVVDWRTGRLELRWKHGGESALQYAWPGEDAPPRRPHRAKLCNNDTAPVGK